MNNDQAPGFIITDKSVTLLWKGESPRVIHSNHINFNEIREKIKRKDWAAAYELSNPKNTIEKFSSGRIEVVNGQILWKGEELHGEFVKRVLKLRREGFDIDPMLNFLDKLQDNPSMVAREELPLFMEASNLPICSDGDFYAYKIVSKDFKDLYTGKIDNSVGQEPKMDRKDVDDNRNKTCSKGLHFAALEYISNYYGSKGDAVIVLKINPSEVVSIPNDYKNQKGRTCRYLVVDHIGYLGEGLSLLPEKSVHEVKEERPTYEKPFWNVTYEFYDSETKKYAENTVKIQAYTEDHAEEKLRRDKELGSRKGFCVLEIELA